MMRPKPAIDIGNEQVFKKLGKCVIAYTDLKAGDELTLEVLSGRIFNAQYLPVRESNKIVGAKLKRDIAKGEPIQLSDIEYRSRAFDDD
jgi:sialic acid synthase